MHTSGKVAVVLVIVLALVAGYFGAKTFAVRDAWMKVAQDNEAAIRKHEAEISELTRKRDEKRKDLARTLLGWDRYWSDVKATPVAGGFKFSIGQNQHVRPEQVLFVFGVNQDGTSTYLGDFKVVNIGENEVAARPNSRRRPNDPQQLPPTFRVRSLLPNRFTTRLAALDQELLAAELTIDANNAELARQKELMEQSTKAIANRMAELDGNPQLAGKTIPIVHVAGLLTSIVEEEEARNAALIESDRLMRELRETRLEFERIRKENKKLVETLPAPSSDPALGSAGR